MALVKKKWPKRGVTFETIRGDFTIPEGVIARAESSGDESEIRRLFAQRLPAGARVHKREKTREGGLRVFWRIVLVVDGR